MRHPARWLALAVTFVAAFALVAGFSGMAGARGSTTIKLGDNFFKPDSKTVRKGTKVRFKWIGKDKHNVVKKRGPGGQFASPVSKERGVHFVKKFKKRGKYKIICTIHPHMKMKLKVR
jgi:plastocyanin